MSDTLTKDEFCNRFVAEMLRRAGSKDRDGNSVEEYAREAAPTYWEEEWQRKDGPEACVEADMDCWE